MARANRPIFFPSESNHKLFDEKSVSFEWFRGMNASVKQKSIKAFHDSASHFGFDNILEISTYSSSELGRSLSAFNLEFNINGKINTVERLYQFAKVLESETDNEGEKPKGKVPLGFIFDGRTWPLSPPTAFYDWLYLNALLQHPELTSEIIKFDAFTDIAFNPKKALNCQARSVAIFLTLKQRNLLSNVKEPESWLRFLNKLESSNSDTGILSQPSFGIF